MKYTFRRDGSPAKLIQLLYKESSLQPAFQDMRRDLCEDIIYWRSEGATRLRVTLYVDGRGAHVKVTVIE